MTRQVQAAQDLISRCVRLRNQGRVEAVLRSEFTSRLRQVFPDPEDATWVNHYTEGEEAGTRVQRDGRSNARFIDNLVNSTVIEYEADLRQTARRDTGYKQVREYAAGTINSGTPASQVRGILSDTVEWYVYDVRIPIDSAPAPYRPEDVELIQIDVFDLASCEPSECDRFVQFLRKHLAREQSRSLTAKSIATDLGLESLAYNRHVHTLTEMVNEARSANTSVALATGLWAKFVDSLEGVSETFRTQSYIDELYLTILARLLCANFLRAQALSSGPSELETLLTGRFFEDDFQLHNMVEQDYFGWVLQPRYLSQIIPIAREIQRDLYAYDFTYLLDEDIFGHLMTQLSRRSARKLLGQEWTPRWLAKAMAEKTLDMLPPSESIKAVDMCCGSGAIVTEVLRAGLRRKPESSLELVSTWITGFDIDPLAVMLAKTNWVITLADRIRLSPAPVVVPVYNADSLFIFAPTSDKLPLPGSDEPIIVDMKGHSITLPAELIRPTFRKVFDGIVDWAYDEAREAKVRSSLEQITPERAEALVTNIVGRAGLSVTTEAATSFAAAAFDLAKGMADLAIRNENGIWAFILRNTYRPSMLTGQFNALVSNPPWMAMSQLANNPYLVQLEKRAKTYGIQPGGAASPHLELATTHLLHAVDRYLKSGAVVTCLLPGTLVNGEQHRKFRKGEYLRRGRKVPLGVLEIWDVATGTFKVRALGLVGKKFAKAEDVQIAAPTGFTISADSCEAQGLEVRQLGNRYIWVLGDPGEGQQQMDTSAAGDSLPAFRALEGADIMPRTAVCVDVLNQSGSEWKVETPQRGSPFYFAVKDAKKLRGEGFSGWVAPQYLHRLVQSLNLMPFGFENEFVTVAIPATRGDTGVWQVLDNAAIRTEGFAQTARRFERIDEALQKAQLGKSLGSKINLRNKLTHQLFRENEYLVFHPAGGGIPCSACLPVDQYHDIVIDQTLYWWLVTNELEAWFQVGVLNSKALSKAILAFMPKGEFGPRHIHTLPGYVVPPFDLADSAHNTIANASKALAQHSRNLIENDTKLNDPSKPIQFRRMRLRATLEKLDEYRTLQSACDSLLSRP